MMANVYSAWSSSYNEVDGSRNILMVYRIFRGDCTRTEKSVSFSFGVELYPVGEFSNSICTWYNNEARYAYYNPDISNPSTVVASAEHVYSYYTTAQVNSIKTYCAKRTSEYLCFTYTNNNILATTNSVTVPISLSWSSIGKPTEKITTYFPMTIPEYHGMLEGGSVEIVDNYNNTFKIIATPATDGINNPFIEMKNLGWMYAAEEDVYHRTYTSGSNIALETSGTENTRYVYARAINVATTAPTGTNSSNITILGSGAVRQYLPPIMPSNRLVRIVYNKDTLTLDENWTFDWTHAIATAANDYSPVKGYKVTLYKNNEKMGTYTTTTATTLVINPVTCGFKVGDTVYASVKAYTQTGKDNVGTTIQSTTDIKSVTLTVREDRGAFKVKANGSWVNGIPWVKVNGNWTPAKSVSIKVEGSWVKSK